MVPEEEKGGPTSSLGLTGSPCTLYTQYLTANLSSQRTCKSTFGYMHAPSNRLALHLEVKRYCQSTTAQYLEVIRLNLFKYSCIIVGGFQET